MFPLHLLVVVGRGLVQRGQLRLDRLMSRLQRRQLGLHTEHGVVMHLHERERTRVGSCDLTRPWVTQHFRKGRSGAAQAEGTAECQLRHAGGD